jgi:hypothetical protein
MIQHTAREDVNNFLGYKVEMRSVSEKGGFFYYSRGSHGPQGQVTNNSEGDSSRLPR